MKIYGTLELTRMPDASGVEGWSNVFSAAAVKHFVYSFLTCIYDEKQQK